MGSFEVLLVLNPVLLGLDQILMGFILHSVVPMNLRGIQSIYWLYLMLHTLSLSHVSVSLLGGIPHLINYFYYLN